MRISNMRIAVLASSASRQGGGVFGAVQPVLLDLRRRGCDARLFAAYDEDAERDRASWQDVPVHLMARRGPRSLVWLPELPGAIAQFGPQLLHSHGLWTHQSATVASYARRLNLPWLVSPHGMLDSWALANSHWRKRLAGLAYENVHLHGAACLHALSEAEALSIRAYGLRNPICVIPNGIDLPGPAPTTLPPWAGELPANARVLLYLGRLHPKKGLSSLIEAWRLVQGMPQSAGWHLVIAGWDQGGYRAQLELQVAQAGLKAQVHFVGPQFASDKAASLAHVNGFVLPSLSEGLPLVILEAWAYRQAVLMTPECNLPEGFHAGAAVEMAARPGSIADALVGFFALSDERRRAMGERGRQLAAERFRWPTIVGEMLAVYRWVLGGGPKPQSVIHD